MKRYFNTYKSKFLIIVVLFNFNCSRNNSINESANVQQLTQLNVYNLNISEPSGIAYNSAHNSLLIVSDGKSEIYEVDFSGNILNAIPTNCSDMEGITLSKNCDTIFVVEETNKLVSTLLYSGNKVASFSVNVATSVKHAMEGITRNNSNGRLTIINEKLPCMVLEFNGTTEIWRKEINYTADISDIFYDDSSDCYWIVSDESQKILKLTKNLDLISQWSINITQAEGITIVNNKIYVVSDYERKMYVFQKP